MGLFKDSDHNHTCPTHSLAENASQPLFGGTSFHHFSMILAGSCAAFACLTVFVLLVMHATHLTKPNEQIKIMRIGLLIPLYSIFSFLSICFPRAYVSLDAWLDVFQSVALGSFFLLMCEFVSPSKQQRDVFFAALKVPDKRAPSGKGGGLVWYKRRWMMIFQYPVVATVAAIATDITQAVGIYCEYSSKPYFAHLWIEIAQSISVVLAVTSVFKFYLALKTHLAHHQPLAKLLAFKLIVFVTFVQGIIFWILKDANVLNPTSKLTWADLNIGLPNLIICVEMVPFSVFFHYAYTYRPYTIRGDEGFSQSYQGGFLGIRAWPVMCNPKETLSAIVFAFRMAGEQRKGGQSTPSGHDYYSLQYQSGRGQC